MPSFGEAPFMIYTFGQEAYFRRHLFSLRIVDYRHGYFYGRTGLKDLSPSPTKNHPPGFQGNYTGGGWEQFRGLAAFLFSRPGPWPSVYGLCTRACLKNPTCLRVWGCGSQRCCGAIWRGWTYPQNLGRASQGCRRAHPPRESDPSLQLHRPPLPFPHPCGARSLTRDLWPGGRRAG